jgi:NAD+ synthase (glutamine-hydrolysing)
MSENEPMTSMRVGLAQLPERVGDISGNTKRVADAMDWAEEQGADVLVLPELVLTGYAMGDLVLNREFVDAAEAATAELAARSGNTVTVLGTVSRVPPRRSWDIAERSVAISAALLSNGEHRGTYHKVLLPTREVFDEGRNFAPGGRPDAVWQIGDVVTGIVICEDAWSDDGPPEAQARGGARILFSLNASPYAIAKPQGRLDLAATVARRNGVPFVYVNLVGGHDELVFDGGSLVVDADGELLHVAASFEEECTIVDVPLPRPRQVTGPVKAVHTRPLAARSPTPPETPAHAEFKPASWHRRKPLAAEVATATDDDAELSAVWRAIVTGTRDFARAHDYDCAVLGLSGGLDAALTAAVAAEALGPDNVLGVAMPGPNTPDHELIDAQRVADSLGIRFDVVVLKPILEGMVTAAAADPPDILTGFSGNEVANGDFESDKGDRRLEPRARAVVLTAISDVRGHLVLATGNKTELAIGAATMHGDMVGGFAPLKDCPKTLLWRLARHRDGAGPRIPHSVLDKEPSARTTGRDELPPFTVLDVIVERYVQHGDGVADLVAAGFDPAVVVDVLRRIDDAEIKRRQIPPGVQISSRAFGTDRRMPITNAWRAHLAGDGPYRDPGTSAASAGRVS